MGDPRKRPVTREPPAGTPLLRFAGTAHTPHPSPRPHQGTPNAERRPHGPWPELTAQQDAVGVVLVGHPGERVAQRPATACTQEHQRVLRSVRLLLPPFRLWLRPVCARHTRPLLQLPIAARVFRQPLLQQRGLAPLAHAVTRTCRRRLSQRTGTSHYLRICRAPERHGNSTAARAEGARGGASAKGVGPEEGPGCT